MAAKPPRQISPRQWAGSVLAASALGGMAEALAVKLAAGSVFLYPSTSLHRVEPVTRAERLAVVGWVQSRVRRADQREILFDLDVSIAELHAASDKSALFDTLCKTRSNLLRMWAEA